MYTFTPINTEGLVFTIINFKLIAKMKFFLHARTHSKEVKPKKLIKSCLVLFNGENVRLTSGF